MRLNFVNQMRNISGTIDSLINSYFDKVVAAEMEKRVENTIKPYLNTRFTENYIKSFLKSLHSFQTVFLAGQRAEIYKILRTELEKYSEEVNQYIHALSVCESLPFIGREVNIAQHLGNLSYPTVETIGEVKRVQTDQLEKIEKIKCEQITQYLANLSYPTLEKIIEIINKYNREKRERRLSEMKTKIKLLLPQIVLFIGGLLITLRLLFPPKYVIDGGARYPVEWDKYLYPVSDIATALLHSIGIIVITGVVYYLLSKKDNGK